MSRGCIRGYVCICVCGCSPVCVCVHACGDVCVYIHIHNFCLPFCYLMQCSSVQTDIIHSLFHLVQQIIVTSFRSALHGSQPDMSDYIALPHSSQLSSAMQHFYLIIISVSCVFIFTIDPYHIIIATISQDK